MLGKSYAYSNADVGVVELRSEGLESVYLLLRQKSGERKEGTVRIFTLKCPAATLVLAVLATASLVASACGGGDSTEGPSAASTPTPTTGETTAASEPGAASSPSPTDPGDLGVFFPRRGQPLDAFPMSGLDGELIVDDAGCLRVVGKGARTVVPVWPYDHLLGTEGGDIYVLDGGNTVAKVGDEVTVVGADFGTSYGGPLVADREGGTIEGEPAKRELYGRCPGSYWLTGKVGKASR